MSSARSQSSSIIDKENYYRFDHDEYKDSIANLKKHIRQNNSQSKIQNETNESTQMLEIAKYITDPEKCPTNIEREWLLNELDCEDLRSREDKKEGSVTKDELWKAYVDINTPIFEKVKFPRVKRSIMENIMYLIKPKSPKNHPQKKTSLKNKSLEKPSQKNLSPQKKTSQKNLSPLKKQTLIE